MGVRIDLTGQRYGRWTVIKYAGSDKRRQSLWLCRCDCGNEKICLGDNLRYGKSKSCGCLMNELASIRSVRHGYSKDHKRAPEYKIWCGMKSRCKDESDTNYHNYGARGIKVCDTWLHDFERFIHDMGRRPSPDYSIDRIDVNGDYKPGNCRWTLKTVQNQNKRIPKNNKTGVKGVYIKNGHRKKKYAATIGINGHQKSLGYFETLQEAAEARKKAEQQYWKHSN